MESLTQEEQLFIVGKFYENNRNNVTFQWACH